MIIWIASYPKSGNTWMRSLLSSYLYSENGKFNFALLKKIPIFPSKKYFESFLNDFSNIKKVSDYWIYAQDRINLNSDKNNFLKTHSALCSLEKNSFTNKRNTRAVIYIVRDPRNVITSVSNHFSKSIEKSFDFISNKNKMLTSDEWGGQNFGITSVLGSWAGHYNSWKNIKFAPILIIKYEDLLIDTQKTFIKVLNFLATITEIKIEYKKVSNVVDSCNFDKLVKLEEKDGFEESAANLSNQKKINFFYLGEKNNWKKLLNSNIEKKITTLFNFEMKELGYL